jgi:hypothetical protein
VCFRPAALRLPPYSYDRIAPLPRAPSTDGIGPAHVLRGVPWDRLANPCITSAGPASRAYPAHNFKQPVRTAHIVPAARSRPGHGLNSPPRGVAERRQAPGCSGIRRACHIRGRPGVCETPCVPRRKDARLSALHHGDLWRSAALPSAALSSAARAASSSQPGRSARRAVPCASRGCGCEPHRGTPYLAPPSGSPLEDAPR